MFSQHNFKYTSKQMRKLHDLRKLIQKSDDLEIGVEDVLLSKFLNFAGWDTEKAYNAIHSYYDFRNTYHDWFSYHPVEYFRSHFKDTLSKFVMAKPDIEGRAIVIFKTIDSYDSDPNYLPDLIQSHDLIFESLLLLPNVQKYGITVIFDLDGITRNLMKLLTPSMCRLMNARNEVLPVCKRVVHIIQRGFLMQIASSLIVPFMDEEFQKNIIIHNGKNFDKLCEMIGAENLPAEYGGSEENKCDVNLIYNHMLKHSDYLETLQQYRKTVSLK